jgi:hypothetical protein
VTALSLSFAHIGIAIAGYEPTNGPRTIPTRYNDLDTHYLGHDVHPSDRHGASIYHRSKTLFEAQQLPDQSIRADSAQGRRKERILKKFAWIGRGEKTDFISQTVFSCIENSRRGPLSPEKSNPR